MVSIQLSTKMKYEAIYDISVLLGSESIDYPQDTPYSRELIESIKDRGICDLSRLVMSSHSGTHLDAPAHFIAGGSAIDHYPIERFILPAQVIAIEDKESIRLRELKHLDIVQGSALLFKTENSISGRCRAGVFSEKFVYLSKEAANFCLDQRVSLIGLDYITIEQYGDNTFALHRTLLSNNILILEGLDLGAVPAGRYILLCLPLKMKGSEASPVRAALIKEKE